MRRQQRQRRIRRADRGAIGETTSASDRRKKNEEEACLTTATKSEEHPDRNADEYLEARLPHPETDSIVFHSSNNTSEIVNDNSESHATASAAAKVSEDILVKDTKILRLIEERGNTHKGKKAQTKGREQMHKNMHQRQKRMKRQMDIQRILEDFKGIRNYLWNQIRKEKSTHHKDKKMSKEKSSRLVEGLSMS